MSAPALPAPTAGLIASLGAQIWLDHTPAGGIFAVLLITHPPAARDDETPEVIEQRMLGIARSLGLGAADELVPDVGERLTIHPQAQVMLHFDGSKFGMRLPINGHWAHTILALERVLLAVGLDPLPRGAHRCDVDEYVDTAAAAKRMRFGSCRAVESTRGGRRALPVRPI